MAIDAKKGTPEAKSEKYTIPGYEDLGEFNSQDEALKALSQRVKDTQTQYHNMANELAFYKTAQAQTTKSHSSDEAEDIDYDPYDPQSMKKAINKMGDKLLKQMEAKIEQLRQGPSAPDPYEVERELQLAKNEYEELKDPMIYGRIRDGLHKYQLVGLQRALATIYPEILTLSPIEFALFIDEMGTGKLQKKKVVPSVATEKSSGRKEVKEESPYMPHVTREMIDEFERNIKPALLKEGKTIQEIEAIFKGKLFK